MDLNTTVVWGRLTRDPEVRVGPSGVNVANFTLDSHYSYNDKAGQKKEEVTFLACIAFGAAADGVREHHRGEPALVSGRLRTVQREYEGRKYSKIELVVSTVTFPQEPEKTLPPAAATAETEKAVPF
jgi:single-strand DNA-binding protein